MAYFHLTTFLRAGRWTRYNTIVNIHGDIFRTRHSDGVGLLIASSPGLLGLFDSLLYLRTVLLRAEDKRKLKNRNLLWVSLRGYEKGHPWQQED